MAAAALPALVVGLLLVLGWSQRFSTDDVFINYRVVKQIEAGNGPVYNIGERVEVATSTLWLVILVISDLLSPLRIEWTAVLVELALCAVGLGAAMAGAVRLTDIGRSEPDRRVDRPGGRGRVRGARRRVGLDDRGPGERAGASRGSARRSWPPSPCWPTTIRRGAGCWPPPA